MRTHGLKQEPAAQFCLMLQTGSEATDIKGEKYKDTNN